MTNMASIKEIMIAVGTPTETMSAFAKVWRETDEDTKQWYRETVAAENSSKS